MLDGLEQVFRVDGAAIVTAAAALVALLFLASRGARPARRRDEGRERVPPADRGLTP